MIQTKILGDAVGIQYQGVQDKSETNNPSSISNGLIVGRFKRGFMGAPFRVNKDNYSAYLGFDAANPDFMAVQDAFRTGINELWIVRVGAPLGKQ